MIHLCRNLYLSADAFQYKVGTARKHHNEIEFRPITSTSRCPKPCALPLIVPCVMVLKLARLKA